MKKQLKDPHKEIDSVTMERENYDSFQSKSIGILISSCTTTNISLPKEVSCLCQLKTDSESTF